MLSIYYITTKHKSHVRKMDNSHVRKMDKNILFPAQSYSCLISKAARSSSGAHIFIYTCQLAAVVIFKSVH